MDNSTLDGLKLAFGVSPSSKLATMILNALLERQEYTQMDEYIHELDNTISFEDFTLLTRGLLATRNKNMLSEFLRCTQGVDVKELLKQLVDEDKRMQAASLYECMVNIDEQFQSAELDKLIGVNQRGESDKTARGKLRVVEKADVNNVINMMGYTQETTSFKDVVGLEKIKKQINKKIILPFQKPSLFERFKKKVGGGVLLYGPPGCGKTLLARATAGECNASFYNIEISDVLDMYIGESEQKLHAVFEKARESTPSVIFFDEIEALAGKREHSRNSSSSNVISQFLTELDGFAQNNSGVLVLASTNVPWSIDPAFLRPGRFDRMFFVPPPDRIARAAIIEHHLKGRPAESNIDFSMLAAKTGGFSGADLANFVEMAADEAIEESLVNESDVKINASHFKVVLQETRATTVEWLTTARNYARYANDGGRYNDVIDFLKKHGK